MRECKGVKGCEVLDGVFKDLFKDVLKGNVERICRVGMSVDHYILTSIILFHRSRCCICLTQLRACSITHRIIAQQPRTIRRLCTGTERM